MGKILIVEDNALNVKLFQDLLTVQGHEIVVSRDGINIEQIATQEQPHLIIMDIQLNGLSGFDLIKDLKKNKETCHIPVIAVTAFAMDSDESVIVDSGCDMYLIKPVSIDKFFKAIDKFIIPELGLDK